MTALGTTVEPDAPQHLMRGLVLVLAAASSLGSHPWTAAIWLTPMIVASLAEAVLARKATP